MGIFHNANSAIQANLFFIITQIIACTCIKYTPKTAGVKNKITFLHIFPIFHLEQIHIKNTAFSTINGLTYEINTGRIFEL